MPDRTGLWSTVSWARRIARLLCIALLACQGAGHAGPVAVPAMTSRVVDLTDTLTQSEGEALRDDIGAIEHNTGAQLAVLVVPTTGEDAIEAYATRVFAQWKLGREDQDDGVLLLVALADRRMRVEVGTGLEGRVTDIQAARILDQELTPRFRHGDFAGGIQVAVQSLSTLIASPSTAIATDDEGPSGSGERLQSLLRRLVDAFSGPSSDSKIWRTALAVVVWTLGVGAWHGSRPRALQKPDVTAHGTGKRGRKSRRNAERKAVLWAELHAGPVLPPRRRWPMVLALLAAGPIAATLALMNLAMPFILFMPVSLMYLVGYLSGRFKTARRVFGGIALAIAGLVALGFYLGTDKAPWLIGGVFVAPLVGLGIAAVVTGIRLHWKRSVAGFMVRLAFVAGAIGFAWVQFAPGPTPDERWIGLALVSFIALVFGFFPATGGSGGNGDDAGDSGWSSGSSSSSSSGSSTSSSSSGGGGSSSGGGASGSW